MCVPFSVLSIMDMFNVDFNDPFATPATSLIPPPPIPAVKKAGADGFVHSYRCLCSCSHTHRTPPHRIAHTHITHTHTSHAQTSHAHIAWTNTSHIERTYTHIKQISYALHVFGPSTHFTPSYNFFTFTHAPTRSLPAHIAC